MPKDLATQLAELEDAERRVRALLAEARGAIQEYKDVRREAKELVARLAADALRGAMGELIMREMRDVVPDISKFKRGLEDDLNEKVSQVVGLLDEIREKQERVAAAYEAAEKQLLKQGYAPNKELIELPIPGYVARKRGQIT